MPAKKAIAKETILKIGAKMIEKGEGKNLNARCLAKAIGCSTQPIYDAFKNMDDFRNQLIDYVRDFYYSFIEEGRNKRDSLYLQYVKNYIKFAHDYPRLFEFIFVDNPYRDTKEEQAFNDAIIAQIEKAGPYSKEIATEFFYQSWIFAHGVAMQITQHYIDWDVDYLYRLLEDNFEALKEYLKGK